MKRIICIALAIFMLAPVTAFAEDIEPPTAPEEDPDDVLARYFEPYLKEYDLNGDGIIGYNDFLRVFNDFSNAYKSGEEYVGTSPAQIALIIVNLPWTEKYPYYGDYDMNGKLNAHDLTLAIRFEAVCMLEGVEYTGIHWEEYIVGLPGDSPKMAFFRIGDADGNGAVSARDVVQTMKYIVDPKIELNIEAADVNCDGKVNARDVTLIMKLLVNGYEVHYDDDSVVCLAFGHSLSATYATEIAHNVYADSPHCVKNTYLVISCGRAGCGHIEKILVSSKRITTCHG